MLSPARRLASRAHTLIRASSTTSTTSSPRPRVIFSGIQPTGIPHLGNYLGALRGWRELQDSAGPQDELFFSIVGWHALTLPPPAPALRAARRDTLAVLLALGLDPKRVVLFHQDHNQDHAELAWILGCVAPVGRMRRMTTWKARLAAAAASAEDAVSDDALNVGLFTYPVLQAADILAYRATHVPVGEDQTQHLELARDLAAAFDRAHSAPAKLPPLFPLPAQLSTPTARVLSLRDPRAKMSKSAADPASRILLTDAPGAIAKKVRAAVTDADPHITYDPAARPGTANLLAILAAAEGSTPAALAPRYAGAGHGKLKADVADAVAALLARPREEYARIRGEEAFLRGVEEDGARRARERSRGVLEEVRRRVGLA